MRVKGWDKFQHFKDRRPPWIKLYRDLLDDIEWHNLSGDNAKFLMMFWLIASEDKDLEGKLPCVKKLAFRLRTTEAVINKALHGLTNFVICDDIKAISEGHQGDAPETETETKKEVEKKRQYGEFNNVLLKEKELEKLKEKYPDYLTRIDSLSMGIESKGYKYKSHYATILAWARNDKPQPKRIDTAADTLAMLDNLEKRK